MSGRSPAVPDTGGLAVLTDDLDRFIEFYTEVFDLDVVFSETIPSFRHPSCAPARRRGCSEPRAKAQRPLVTARTVSRAARWVSPSRWLLPLLVGRCILEAGRRRWLSGDGAPERHSALEAGANRWALPAAAHVVAPAGIAWVEVSIDEDVLSRTLGQTDVDVRLVGGPKGLRGVGIRLENGRIVAMLERHWAGIGGED